MDDIFEWASKFKAIIPYKNDLGIKNKKMLMSATEVATKCIYRF